MKFAAEISWNHAIFFLFLLPYPKLIKQKSNNPQQKYEALKFKVSLQTLKGIWNVFQTATSKSIFIHLFVITNKLG